MDGNTILSVNLLSILVIVMIILFLVIIYLLVTCMLKLKKYQEKNKRIWEKFNNKNLEEDINKIIEVMEKTQEEFSDMQASFSEVSGKMSKCVQKMSIVKYNAYEEGANGTSFSIALLDDKDNGVLLNNVYNRNFSNIYAKEVVNGQINGILTKEEEEALNKAKQQKSFM